MSNVVEEYSHSNFEHRFYQGLAASCVANCLQAVNFLSDRFMRKSYYESSKIEDLFKHSMSSAFSVQEAFLVTGAPHASAYYPRDFAWFYPDVLDPETIMDSEDALRRIRLLEKSVRLMLGAVRSGIVTTTLIPVGKKGRHIGANYFSLPSDTLLGIMAGVEQLTGADHRSSPYPEMTHAAKTGHLLVAEYRNDLKKAVCDLARSLEKYEDNGISALLCDVSGPRSAATDTRAERLRFVTNASIYATFQQAIRLDVIDRSELETILGRDLPQYKRELLKLFGRRGYITHSLDCVAEAASSIALDFVNVQRGFWNLKDEKERALFAATTDLVLAEPRFRIPDTFHFLVSTDNPRKKFIHRIATPSYQGRSSWPTFNVEFADRMLDYDECSGTEKYRFYAQQILRHIHDATETHGGYQELLSEDGLQYRTWAYRGAVAHSWFPRFLTVWSRAFGAPMINWTRSADTAADPGCDNIG